jgi:GxxExxY protein
MMSRSPDRQALNEVTEKVIGCAFTVSNGLGNGFLEKVYENALAHEMRKIRLDVRQQHRVPVRYENVVVGEYVADLLVDDSVLVELKVVEALIPVHHAQCVNYLKATGLPICLLFNFGRPKIQIRRIAN